MVKTIHLSDEIRKELMKIQGELQAQTGEFTTMDETIKALWLKPTKGSTNRLELDGTA